MARRDLFPDSGLARSAGLCHFAISHFDAYSRFSTPMGSAQTDSALDNTNLALRISYRGSRLFDALPMVPSAAALARDVKSLRRQNLALSDDLMFDQSHMPPRMKETLW